MRREKAFKPLTLKLSSITDETVRHQLEVLFDEFTAERAKANQAVRKAALADAESGIAQQRARMAFVQLLLTAGEAGGAFDAVKGEQTWTAYRKDGELLFECPFTEVDMRNAMRVQRANVDQAARSIGGAESLYEDEDADEKDPVIGFAGGSTSRSH
ncbi:hypothetical protein D4R30_00695 [archaeon]|nr:MAG: hypothetical protein D4R30_00695 [archaeon]